MRAKIDLEYPYLWNWRYRPPDRYKARCRIVHERPSGTVLIEFKSDRQRFITDKRGLVWADVGEE